MSTEQLTKDPCDVRCVAVAGGNPGEGPCVMIEFGRRRGDGSLHIDDRTVVALDTARNLIKELSVAVYEAEVLRVMVGDQAPGTDASRPSRGAQEVPRPGTTTS